MTAKIFYWYSIAFLIYSYFGYLAILIVLSRFRSRPVRKRNIFPRVSFIIAAYNEEKTIKEKIENTQRQDYPREHFEVIVASDCSTDRTDQIVNSFSNVRLIRAPKRAGKEGAQKLAIAAATGEILVFSDAATILDQHGITSIIKNFADPTVGCASSVDKFINKDGKIGGEGTYVRYEMLLRQLESKIDTTVGLSGSFFAARKDVCAEWLTGQPSDFTTVFNSVKKGLRGVVDKDCIGYYNDIADEKKEFNRKVRTIVRGISATMQNLSLLDPLQYGFFSWTLFSHKICRWLSPFLLGIFFLANCILTPLSFFYAATLAAQCALYGAGVASLALPCRRRTAFFKIPAFFLLVNISIVKAWYLYFRGSHLTFWEPSCRSEYNRHT